MALENATKKIAVVISLRERDYAWAYSKLCELNNTFNEEFECWSSAIHDKDTTTNSEGEVVPKTLHIHFFGIGKRKKLLTYLNQFAIWFEVSNLAVSIQAMKDFTSSTQYLIHLNDLDKYQYDRSIIISSLNKEDLNRLLDEYIQTSFNEDKLIFYLGTSSNMVELIKRCGLVNFKNYCNVIRILLDNGYKIGFMRVDNSWLTKD